MQYTRFSDTSRSDYQKFEQVIFKKDRNIILLRKSVRSGRSFLLNQPYTDSAVDVEGAGGALFADNADDIALIIISVHLILHEYSTFGFVLMLD
jgi:hypothetical protein